MEEYIKNQFTESYNGEQWFDLAKELAEIREKERARLPYSFNVVDELRANENAHTRVLIKLLSYTKKGEYPFLKTFFERIRNKCEDFNVHINNPQIKFNSDNIDGLIEDAWGAYSIIIENKIHFAADQDRQIERYFNIVKDRHKINGKHIYVIYLTLNGLKEVSSTSLPNSLKEELGKRFITMNYRDDILPWLEREVLPEIKITEKLLEYGISQYIDHLKGKLDIRESEKPIRDMMENIIKKKLGIDTLPVSEQWRKLKKSIENVKSLSSYLQDVYDKTSDNIISVWDDVTVKNFQEADDKEGHKVNNAINHGGFYQLFFNGVEDNIHFEWCPLDVDCLFNEGVLNYRMNLHVENDHDEVKLRRIRRNEFFISEAKKLGYVVPATDNWAAIYKDYQVSQPFAKMSETDRKSFLDDAYKEVTRLMNEFEATYSLLQNEEDCIKDLISSMNEGSGHNWTQWNELIVAAFNENANKIGIEGRFKIRGDKQIVFFSWITVWDERVWNTYDVKLKEKYPNESCMNREKRMYLYLPEIEIGADMNSCWNNKKESVINSLRQTFDTLKGITDEVGK